MNSISQRYMTVVGNMSRHAPMDLDERVGITPLDHADGVPQIHSEVPPSAALWVQPEEDASYIGIRVTSPISSLEDLAVSLSAIAVEKQIIPIFISWIGDCGLQRFGLRVEHISAETDADRHALEEQLKRLWKLAVIIDASDVSAL